ncbi:MAG: nucleotide exchange factor GrpE [Peptococcaceae bacterium]|nr:nucleotide exchange factor GrpE [Peptococcaceae bacterium]
MEEQKKEDEVQPQSDATHIAQVAELHAKLLRLQADMDNMRRRHQREKEELGYMAAADCIYQLLPAMDNFDRAVKLLPAGDWTQGMVMVHKQLQDILQCLGLEPIAATGAFDPELHEAVAIDEDSTDPENSVTQELERGYKYRNRVLRPSKVRVSMGGCKIE